MFFPISGSHISPIYLVVVGFFIGILGGFFGVGGSFIAGPALRAVGLDWNFAVGTDLAHIVGKSVVAAKRHRALGNVDLKLGLIMAFGTIGGAEVGAQLIQMLKRAGNVNLVVSIVSIVVYISISSFMIWESRKTLRSKKGGTVAPPTSAAAKKHDPSSFAHVTRSIQRWKIWPMIKLPASGVTISLWVILLVAFVGGLFSGFLGGGAGYIRMPSMVYVLGIPTHLAVGTDLFEIIISASYGTFSHAIKGNVDILIALVMNIGAAIGAQIGAISTQYFIGRKIRLAFVPLPLIGAATGLYWRSEKTYEVIKSIPPPVLVAIGECTTLKKFLVCTGGQEFIEDAVQLAGKLAAAVGASVTLLHVMAEPPAIYADLVQMEEDVDRLLESKSELGVNLRRQRESLERLGVPTEVHVRHGIVLDQVFAEAREGDHDSIVTGSSQARGLLRHYIMGDLTRSILNHANCPVLVARGGRAAGAGDFWGFLSRLFRTRQG